jgi:mannose-6-phosphate isomerase-like protein (cupin superfamily)
VSSAITRFFGGRVEIKSLAVTDQPATRTDPQARIISPKGELAVLGDGSISIHHLAYVELRAAMVRGDHYHKLRHEYFYLISGALKLNLQDVSTGERASIEMKAGDLAYITPGIAHALHPLKEGHGIEFAVEQFDQADVYRHLLDA